MNDVITVIENDGSKAHDNNIYSKQMRTMDVWKGSKAMGSGKGVPLHNGNTTSIDGDNIVKKNKQ